MGVAWNSRSVDYGIVRYFWEVPLMAMISELYFQMTGQFARQVEKKKRSIKPVVLQRSVQKYRNSAHGAAFHSRYRIG